MPSSAFNLVPIERYLLIIWNRRCILMTPDTNSRRLATTREGGKTMKVKEATSSIAKRFLKHTCHNWRTIQPPPQLVSSLQVTQQDTKMHGLISRPKLVKISIYMSWYRVDTTRASKNSSNTFIRVAKCPSSRRRTTALWSSHQIITLSSLLITRGIRRVSGRPSTRSQQKSSLTAASACKDADMEASLRLWTST